MIEGRNNWRLLKGITFNGSYFLWELFSMVVICNGSYNQLKLLPMIVTFDSKCYQQ